MHVSVTEYPTAEQRTIDELQSIILASRTHLKVERGDDGGLFNDYDDIDFINSKITSAVNRATIETSMDRLNYRDNFVWYNRYYGNTVVVQKKKAEETDDTKYITTDLAKHSVDVSDEKATEMNAAMNLTLAEVDKLKSQLEKQEKVRTQGGRTCTKKI